MMDREDLELFERSVRAAVDSADVDASLHELGWHDALSIDARAAVSVLFDLQGRANATSSAIDHVLLAALDLEPGTGVVLPAPGSVLPPAIAASGRITVRGLATTGSAAADRLVVVTGDGDTAMAMSVATADLEHRTVEGLDPGARLVVVAGECAAEELGPVDWPAAVRRCQVALAHELVGASRQMLELARQHALERIQFGVPIASFQAVRHRLAETLVAIEMAEAALDATWLEDAWHHVVIAKALAGGGARTTARQCQQVLAGIGYTLEHPFHGYLRRVLLLDELFGSSRSLTAELGRAILRSGDLPPLLPL